MGLTTCTNIITELENSDYINILSIFINGILAIWIVNSIQNKLNNKRVLKDYFINEIKDIRMEYRMFLNEIYKKKIKPDKVSPWLKLMNIRTNDLMALIQKKHNIKKDFLTNYHVELRNLITEDINFITNFKLNDDFALTDESKKNLIVFQQKNNSLFNLLVIKINDAS